MQKIINVSDLNEIVLTNDGVVVGHIKIKRTNSNIDFKGQAVNYRPRVSIFSPSYDPSSYTNHGFGCGLSIDKSNVNDVKIQKYLQTQVGTN